MSQATSEQLIFKNMYPEEQTPENCDFAVFSLPIPVLFDLLESQIVHIAKQMDKAMHEGLSKAGFKLTWSHKGGREVGLYGLVLARGGGYCEPQSLRIAARIDAVPVIDTGVS